MTTTDTPDCTDCISQPPATPTRGWVALSPIAVFLLSYVAVSLILNDFYAMPLSVSLLISSVWAIIIYRGHPLPERIAEFSRGAGHENILYMVWIFILAGAFSMIASKMGAVEATVQIVLGALPATMILPAIFIAACFISLSIGTSVGTVVALTPLASEMASATGGEVAMFVAVVLGGAFFGDNLSFISDTTIAATRTQHVGMSDKFKFNLRIAVPAALIALAIYVGLGQHTASMPRADCMRPWLVLPYLVVIVSAIAGINVSVVLTLGITTAIIVGMSYGFTLLDLAGFAGKGIESMGGLIIVTLLAAGMLGVVRAAGGINHLLTMLSTKISGARGAQALIALLVSVVNMCTANNTVAIITVGELAHSIAQRFGVDPRKSASLLDSASCVVQSLIPYGAQTLLATSLAGLSPAAPWPYLYYPWALGAMIIISILLRRRNLEFVAEGVVVAERFETLRGKA